ncbi:hypothetical protein BRADI_4g25730v3 [Brachypodium distachyon]|uniref:Uncharacterized protein n=1 Tax=Brachypodium distachyon TaxID=15368 RepID=A0A2K2CQ93_BRADI|nr:hypothetical protein BRADI_4g25730v3 [Brachypodium distachyon]
MAPFASGYRTALASAISAAAASDSRDPPPPRPVVPTGGGGFLSWLFAAGPAHAAAEPSSKQGWDAHGLGARAVPLARLDGRKRYKVSDVSFLDATTPRCGGRTGPEDPLFESSSLRPGGVYTRAKILEELKALSSSGLFERVRLNPVRPNPDGTLALTVAYAESAWPAARRLRCANGADAQRRQRQRQFESEYERRLGRAAPCVLPERVRAEVAEMVRRQGKVTARLLQRVRDMVQKWYHDEGFVCAQVVNFGNLDAGEVVCEVVEGEVTGVEYQFLDKLGNDVEGRTRVPVIDRELPQQLRPGHIFSIEAGKQAQKNIHSLGVFSNIEVNPCPDDKTQGDPKSAEVTADWSIVPGRQGRPTLQSIQPGGSVSFEHRNICGLNRSLTGSVASSNLLNPQDDLSFKLEYTHPYLDGVKNHGKNRTFKTSCFNTKKLSPVFVTGPGMEEALPMGVEMKGLHFQTEENLTKQSKLTYGLVVEEITTHDKSNDVCTHGLRTTATGALGMDGPPTMFSGTGVDRMAFLQANVTQDNTEIVNGATIGDRCIFQLDQGLGIGSKNPFFNRHQLTMTKFMNLNKQENGAGKPLPVVLVAHGRYAGCVGDLPSYETFPLGGPHSVRGYGMGELGASRNLLEVAAEVRIPVPLMKKQQTQVYAFAKHGTDLGSSKDVKGNPTEFFQRAGHGSSYSVGVKLGPIRAEYAVDHNAGTGALFFRFGERF